MIAILIGSRPAGPGKEPNMEPRNEKTESQNPKTNAKSRLRKMPRPKYSGSFKKAN